MVYYTEQFLSDKPINAGDCLEDDQVPESPGVVLDYMQRSYLPFATENIAVGLAGEKYYQYDYGIDLIKVRSGD